MQIRGVLFDFGSTLFAHAPLAETIRRAAADLGVEVDSRWAAELSASIETAAQAPDELALGRDLSTDVWAQRWPELYAVGDGTIPGLGAQVYRRMHDPAEWVPYPATRRVLSTLSAAGVGVGIVSNTGWDVRTVFAHHDLASFVSGGSDSGFTDAASFTDCGRTTFTGQASLTDSPS